VVRFKGVRPVGVLSAAGELVLRRRYYWGRGAGGCYPSDGKAGIAASAVTAGARELCGLMGMTSDFRTAARDLRRVGGLAVGRERLRQLVEAEAARAAALRDAGVVPAAWSARADGLEKGRLYVGVDGLLVRAVTQAEKDKRRRAHATRRRLRGRRGVSDLRPLPAPRPGADQPFKEVKFAVLYDQPKEHRHALATAGDGAGLGRLLRSHAAQVGIDYARQKVGLTDGAAWIARQLEVNLPMLTARLLDFYHLASHVHEAARACLGEGTAEAAAWAQARLHDAKHRGPAPVLAAADALAKSVRSPPKREALRRLRHYVAERAKLGMLDYPAARRRGWDVGSGPTESMGKNLARRLRGPGMKWDLDHAADLMNLKAMYESGQSQTYWSRYATGACLN
jgi:hypothetical protein